MTPYNQDEHRAVVDALELARELRRQVVAILERPGHRLPALAGHMADEAFELLRDAAIAMSAARLELEEAHRAAQWREAQLRRARPADGDR